MNSDSVDALPPQPLDAITVFAVPDPGCPHVASSRFFRVWLPGRGRANRPAYFGLADYVRQPILSANVIYRISLELRGVKYSGMVHFPNWERSVTLS